MGPWGFVGKVMAKTSICCWVLVLVSVLGGGHRRGGCCLESLLFVLVFVARRVSGEERRERGGCGRALWCWERDGVACL